MKKTIADAAETITVTMTGEKSFDVKGLSTLEERVLLICQDYYKKQGILPPPGILLKIISKLEDIKASRTEIKSVLGDATPTNIVLVDVKGKTEKIPATVEDGEAVRKINQVLQAAGLDSVREISAGWGD